MLRWKYLMCGGGYKKASNVVDFTVIKRVRSGSQTKRNNEKTGELFMQKVNLAQHKKEKETKMHKNFYFMFYCPQTEIFHFHFCSETNFSSVKFVAANRRENFIYDLQEKCCRKHFSIINFHSQNFLLVSHREVECATQVIVVLVPVWFPCVQQVISPYHNIDLFVEALSYHSNPRIPPQLFHSKGKKN